MFLSFFADFDWSVGKIKLFLHFDKTPCAGIFDICLDFTVIDCVDNNELYINYLLELDLLDFTVRSFWENSIGLKMATHSSYPFHYFFYNFSYEVFGREQNGSREIGFRRERRRLCFCS